jgi:hypothetical protein
VQLNFRMYSIDGCKFCQAAKELFEQNEIELEVVRMDQLLFDGIAKSLGVQQVSLPIVANYLTNELCLGYKTDVLNTWINLAQSLRGGVVYQSTNDSNTSEQTAQLV